MTGEQVPAWLLEPGDLIRARHHHDALSGECLACWQADVVVTGRPVLAGGRLAVTWAGDTRIRGSRPGVTGISLFWPGEQALRLGRLPAQGGLALATAPRQAGWPWCRPPGGVTAARRWWRSAAPCAEGSPAH